MKIIKSIILSLRPHQWFKNVFLFAGIIFSGRFFDIQALSRASEGFLVFCAIASGIYILNDLKDIEADRAHPDKKFRPIASGDLPTGLALIIGLFLLTVGLTGAYFLGLNFLLVSASYVVIQIFYIFLFKYQPILDIIMVAAGFVIRAVAGGVVIDVPISSWLLVCTSLLALFLVTEKRRSELARVFSDDNGEDISSRPSLKNYTIGFLDNMATIEISATLVAYMLYVFSEQTFEKFNTYALGFTIPFVLYGLFRYLWLVHRKDKGESPVKLFLNDIPSITNLVFWGLVVFIVLYLR